MSDDNNTQTDHHHDSSCGDNYNCPAHYHHGPTNNRTDYDQHNHRSDDQQYVLYKYVDNCPACDYLVQRDIDKRDRARDNDIPLHVNFNSRL